MTKKPSDSDPFRIAALAGAGPPANPNTSQQKQKKGKQEKDPKKKKSKKGKGFLLKAEAQQLKDAGKWEEFCTQRKAEAKEKATEKAKISATALNPAVATTSTANPASILKKDSQPFVRAAAEAIDKAVTFGATIGKAVLQGQQVCFNVAVVETSGKEKASGG